MFLKVLFALKLTLMTWSLVLCLGAVLQMQYTSSDKCRKNTFLGRKKIYFVFVDLEKAFGRVSHSVLWWAMRKLEIDGWIVRLLKVVYDDAKSRIRVNSYFSERFEVTVGVHQGSVLSPLLFAIVMEAFCRECPIGCSWELLY